MGVHGSCLRVLVLGVIISKPICESGTVDYLPKLIQPNCFGTTFGGTGPAIEGLPSVHAGLSSRARGCWRTVQDKHHLGHSPRPLRPRCSDCRELGSMHAPGASVGDFAGWHLPASRGSHSCAVRASRFCRVFPLRRRATPYKNLRIRSRMAAPIDSASPASPGSNPGIRDLSWSPRVRAETRALPPQLRSHRSRQLWSGTADQRSRE